MVRLENEKILVSAEAVLPLIAVPLSNEQGNKTVTKLFLKKNEQGVLKYFEERTVKCFPVEAATNGYVKKRKKKKRR